MTQRHHPHHAGTTASSPVTSSTFAAMVSYDIEPITDRRIHDSGVPMVAASAIIASTMGTDGTMENVPLDTCRSAHHLGDIPSSLPRRTARTRNYTDCASTNK